MSVGKIKPVERRQDNDFSPMSITGLILNKILYRDVDPEELNAVDSKYSSKPIPFGEELHGLYVPGDETKSGIHELYTNKRLNPEDKVFAYNHEVLHYLVKYFKDLNLIGEIPEAEEEKIANIYASGDLTGVSGMLKKYGLPEGFDVGRLLNHYLGKYSDLEKPGRDN